MRIFCKKNNKGFTLVEIIMTIMVGYIIIPPIILMIVVSLQAPAILSGTIKGNSLASDLMEEILSKSFDENSSNTGPIGDASKTLPEDLGPEAGESRASFDDIDDYNGYTESPPQTQQGQVITDFPDFTRKVEIFYVQGGSSGDYDTPQATVTHFKKIRVTAEGSRSKNQVEAVVCNR